MEIKKNKKVAIERYRTTWLMMGLVIGLACMFMAFEWSKHDLVVDTSLSARGPEFEPDIDDIIRTYDQPMPPPPPEPVSVPEILNIVDNDDDVEEGSIQTTESLAGTAVNVRYIAPEPLDDSGPDEIEIFVAVEKMPEFPGGQAALMQFLSKNIKYPGPCAEQGIQGRVIVQFIVDRNGGITNPKVVRGVHPLIDKEALRVIGTMPKWTPGMQHLKPVPVMYTVPVTFRLQ